MRLSADDKQGIPAKSAMEMAALSTLRHPNVVTCYACLTDMVQEQQPAAAAAAAAAPDGQQRRNSLAVTPSITASSFIGSNIGRRDSAPIPMFRPQQQQGLLGIRFRHASASDLSAGCCDSFNILVMERCDRGNLADAVRAEGLLHRRGPDGVLRVSMGLLYTVLLDVAAALRYMHSLGLVHLDVKASNVLLQTTAGRPGGFPVAKLGDLGLVKLLGEAGSLVNCSTSGTLTHLAPERLQAGSLITPAADTYSFGVLMYELYTGQQPYTGQEQGLGLMRAVFNGLRPCFPESTPPGYRALAEACFARHINQRPCFEEVVARLQVRGEQ
jgi:serine/threonine protein kinase